MSSAANSNFGSVVPCANKKVGRFKRAGFAEEMVFLVGEIGVLIRSFFPVASKQNLGENQPNKFKRAC